MSLFGVVSCARMTRERAPPATKNTRLVTTYRIPIRLWSTVVSQPATLPRFQSLRYGVVSTLTATCRSPLRREASLQVGDRRGDLLVAPALPDGRHPVLPFSDQRLHALGVEQRRAALERRAVVALAGEPVALRAGAVERLA